MTGTKASGLPPHVERAITAPDGRVAPTEPLSRVAGSLVLPLDVAAVATVVQLVRSR